MPTSIFVVEDDEAVRMALVRWLTQQGQRVRAFESGEALLGGFVKEDIPDLILLDLRMPGMNGLEALKLLRQKVPDALVIMMTAFCTVEEAVEAMKLGAHDLVIKGGDLLKLQWAINGALESLASRRKANLGM